MKKIEFIWRHLLFECIEKRNIFFRQQDLAVAFGISSSTVSLALSPLRKLGAVKIGGRGFEITDYEKILYHWANNRNLSAQIAIQMSISLPISEIEGLLPEGSIPTAYTRVREIFVEAPSDYDKVYCYHNNPKIVADRFEGEKTGGSDNLFVLREDPEMHRYGNNITLAQLFIDLWNMTDWYAKDFSNLIKRRIDELLS